MPHTKIRQPSYYARFACVGAACPDNCCREWGVVIDRTTYQRYQACNDPLLRTVMQGSVRVNENATSEENHAIVSLNETLACPFLDERRLCEVQKRLGEDWLSQTCAFYPRNLNIVDGVLEASLNLSCPEAARMALLEPTRMRLVEVEHSDIVSMRAGDTPVFASDTPDTPASTRHFQAIRRVIIDLLQDRARPLPERLVHVGTFCNELQMRDGTYSDDETASWLYTYTSNITHTGSGLGEVQSPQLSVQQLLTLLSMIELRLTIEPTTVRFQHLVDEARQGLGYSPAADATALWSRYQTALRRDLEPVLTAAPHILENYLVNYVFKSLFPFAPHECRFRKNIYRVEKDFMSNYALMVVHVALIQVLLTGIAAARHENFDGATTIDVIQVFAKNVEHSSLPYLTNVLESMKRYGLVDLRPLTQLIWGLSLGSVPNQGEANRAFQ